MTTPYTPQPANGAALYALGDVQLPTDSDPPRGGIVRATGEKCLDISYFLALGPTGDPDYKITGNGVPPAGGYTPTTNPIYILGTGVRVAGAGLQVDTTLALDGATVTGAFDVSGTPTFAGASTFTAKRSRSGSTATDVMRDAPLNASDATLNIGDDADRWALSNPTNAATTITVDDPGLPDLVVTRLRVYDLAGGKTVDIERAGGEVIASLTGPLNFFGVDLEFSGGRWSVGMFSADLPANVTLVNPQ